MAQMAYGIVTIPRVGEAVMGLARDALTWAPRKVIRRIAGRYTGASVNLEETMDDSYLDDLRDMYAAEGFHNAYLSTVRALVNPRALLGGHHDVTRRLTELKIPVQLIWGAADPLFPLAHAERAQSLIGEAALAVIDGAGHTPQAEQSAEFNRVLHAFLDA
jgi:pimeloyl-ACP methyl ester carboxylesterase